MINDAYLPYNQDTYKCSISLIMEGFMISLMSEKPFIPCLRMNNSCTITQKRERLVFYITGLSELSMKMSSNHRVLNKSHHCPCIDCIDILLTSTIVQKMAF